MFIDNSHHRITQSSPVRLPITPLQVWKYNTRPCLVPVTGLAVGSGRHGCLDTLVLHTTYIPGNTSRWQRDGGCDGGYTMAEHHMYSGWCGCLPVSSVVRTTLDHWKDEQSWNKTGIRVSAEDGVDNKPHHLRILQPLEQKHRSCGYRSGTCPDSID